MESKKPQFSIIGIYLVITINEKLRKRKNTSNFKSPSQSDGLKTKNEVRLPLALLLSTPVCQGWVESSHISCSGPGSSLPGKARDTAICVDSWDSRGERLGTQEAFYHSFWGIFL